MSSGLKHPLPEVSTRVLDNFDATLDWSEAIAFVKL